MIVQHRGYYLMNHHMAHAGFKTQLALPPHRVSPTWSISRAGLPFIHHCRSLASCPRLHSKVGPTISAIWERRELENPSTRRAPKLLEDLPRAGLPASASFLEAASLTLWSLTDV